MRSTARAGLIGLLAALLLASALSAASARNLELSEQRIRVTWSRIEFGNSLFTLSCQLTLEGSFHSRTIAKVAGLLIGSITRTNLKSETCSGLGGGTATPKGFPWHLTYESFTGTLPSITSIRLLLSRFLMEFVVLGIRCTYGTTTDNVTFSAALNAAREVTNLTPLEGRNVGHKLEGGEFCPPELRLMSTAGDGLVRVLNTTTRVRVTLI